MINLSAYQHPFYNFFAERIRERESLTLPTGEILYFDGDGEIEGLDHDFAPTTKSGDSGQIPEGYQATSIYYWSNSNNGGSTYCFHPPHIKIMSVDGFAQSTFSAILESGEAEQDFFNDFVKSQKIFNKGHIPLLEAVGVDLRGKELYYESYNPPIPRNKIQSLLDRGLYYFPYV